MKENVTICLKPAKSEKNKKMHIIPKSNLSFWPKDEEKLLWIQHYTSHEICVFRGFESLWFLLDICQHLMMSVSAGKLCRWKKIRNGKTEHEEPDSPNS